MIRDTNREDSELEKQNITSKVKRKRLSLRSLGSSFLFQVTASAVVTCIIEYYLFQSENIKTAVSPLAFGSSLFLSCLFVLFFSQSINIKIDQKHYFREDFSFYSVFSIITLAITTGLGLFTGLVFWSGFEQVIKLLSNQNTSVRNVSLLDYSLSISIIVILMLVFSQWHSQWQGRISSRQYRQSQNSEYRSFLVEGIEEITRRCIRNGKPPLTQHDGIDKKSLQLQLSSQKALAWKERAKELFRLSSSSYAFTSKNSWHDREGCWIGENLDTDQLVFLYPFQVELTQAKLESISRYTGAIKTQRNKEISEIVIAFQQEQLMKKSFDEGWERVRFVTQESLLMELVDFTDYRNEIHRRVTVSTLPDVTDIPLTVDDVYVDSQFSYLKDESSSKESVEEYLLKWLGDSIDQKQIALLGDYGQGKSTTTLMFTYHLLFENHSYFTKRIPILMELRGKSP